jgi:hypothetical protein
MQAAGEVVAILMADEDVHSQVAASPSDSQAGAEIVLTLPRRRT